MSDNYSDKLMTRGIYRASFGWLIQACERCASRSNGKGKVGNDRRGHGQFSNKQESSSYFLTYIIIGIDLNHEDEMTLLDNRHMYVHLHSYFFSWTDFIDLSNARHRGVDVSSRRMQIHNFLISVLVEGG